MIRFRLIKLGSVIQEQSKEFDDDDAKTLAMKEALHDPLQEGPLFGTWVEVKEVRD